MQPQRLALIANPQAGARNARDLVSQARRELWGYELELIFPNSRDELSRVVESLTPDQHRAAVIFGGDGTVNLALQAVWSRSGSEQSIPIYAFPAGTANDLSTELGIGPSFSQLQRLIDDGHHSRMDVISCNGRPFTTVAGIGVGATLTQAINDTRRQSRIFCSLMQTLKAEIYTAMSAKTILTSRSYLHRVDIRSDAFSERMRIAALFVCNQDRLGGDIHVGANNSNQDGIFSVLIIPAGGPLSLLNTLLEFRRGRIPDHVISFSTRKLEVHSLEEREIPVFGDGEALLRGKSLHFEIHPASFPIFREARPS